MGLDRTRFSGRRGLLTLVKTDDPVARHTCYLQIVHPSEYNCMILECIECRRQYQVEELEDEP